MAAIALTPSAPVLVPELAGAAAAEVAGFRTAAVAAAAELPARWIAIGVGPGEAVYRGVRGSFGGYGVDVGVALDPRAPADVVALPLCALIAGWLRGQVDSGGSVTVRVYAADLDADDACARGGGRIQAREPEPDVRRRRRCRGLPGPFAARYAETGVHDKDGPFGRACR